MTSYHIPRQPKENPTMFSNEATRAYIYRIVTAVIPLLVVLGYLAGDQVQLWLGLAAAVLGVGAGGLAVGHTSTNSGH